MIDILIAWLLALTMSSAPRVDTRATMTPAPAVTPAPAPTMEPYPPPYPAPYSQHIEATPRHRVWFPIGE